MARRKKHGFRNFVVLCLIGVGVWVYWTQPRREYEAKIDRAVKAYKAKKEEARQKAKVELKDLLDKTLGK